MDKIKKIGKLNIENKEKENKKIKINIQDI